MDLDQLEPGIQCPLGGVREVLLGLLQIGVVHHLRRQPAVGQGEVGGAVGLPELVAVGDLLRADRTAALPGPLGGGLAPAMADLHPRHRPLLADEIGDRPEAVDLRLVVQTGTAVGDSPGLGHAGRLDDHGPGAAHGELAVMHQVIRRRHAVHGRVLVHRRDDDAVVQSCRSDGQRLEKARRCAHEFLP